MLERQGENEPKWPDWTWVGLMGLVFVLMLVLLWGHDPWLRSAELKAQENDVGLSTYHGVTGEDTQAGC
jgi:hypothetical protein